MTPNFTARRGCAIGAVLVGLCLPGGLSAQRLVPEFYRAPDVTLAFGSRPTSQPAALAFGHPDDYRWEGVLVGGIGLGLLAAYAFHEFCRFSETGPSNCTPQSFGGFLIGGTAGVVVGGLLGGLIPKAKS